MFCFSWCFLHVFSSLWLVLGFSYISLWSLAHPSPSMLSVTLRPIHLERQLFDRWNRWDNEAIQQSGIITFPLLRCLNTVARRSATGTETGQLAWKMAGLCPWLDRLHSICVCSGFREKKKKSVLLQLSSDHRPFSCRGGIRFLMTGVAPFPLTAIGREDITPNRL